MSNRKSAKGKSLFDDEEHQDDHELKVNKDFAKKFEHTKRREILDKGKEKYGELVLLDEEES